MFSFNSQPSSMVQAFKKHRDCWTITCTCSS